MKPVSIVWVLAVGLVAAVLSFLGFFAHMREGGTPMIVTPGPAVIFAIATACLIWSGLAVRRLRAGKETWIDAIGAMRVAVLIGVASFMTFFVYGLVALLVKADDFGLHLAKGAIKPEDNRPGLVVDRNPRKVT